MTTNQIRDPAQAWNAITVGAYTNKVLITEADAQDYMPIADAGGLSPYTTTSGDWNQAWPLKPDVVFEGGNVGKDAIGSAGISSLHLLTTNNLPNQRLFTTTNATSAASALGARMAAQLMAAYPALRPETIRGLIVHSAEWTEAMRTAYLPMHKAPTKSDYVHLIRHCGWGAPDIDQALWSAGNSLTLIVEDLVHPYQKVKGKGVVSRDMNLHNLPWPKEQLQALPPDTKVELRITLSYFIEPNPSARGTSSKFYYPSHRLRFDVQRPLDATTEDFVARINAAVEREDDDDAIDSKDPNWVLGDLKRHRLTPSRHLARHGCSVGKPWLHRRLPSQRLVAHPSSARALRPACPLQPYCFHPHSRDGCGSLHTHCSTSCRPSCCAGCCEYLIDQN